MPIDDALKDINNEEEIERAIEEKEAAQLELARQKQIEEELREQLKNYESRLQSASSDLQEQVIKSHLKGLYNFWPGEIKDSLDESVVRLVTSDDFPEIYKNALVLKTPVNRFEYIFMVGMQRKIFDTLVDRTKFFSKLTPLGLGIICPYFECNRDLPKDINNINYVTDKCLISGEEIMAFCEGKHHGCPLFGESMRKFATGELPLIEPRVKYSHPELIIPDNERDRLERKLLNEIETYWREGDD